MTDTTTPPAAADGDAKTFADFGVQDAIVGALDGHGITTPFPIQELTLPLALSGADLIGQARTGTGKTLAFGIPLLQRLDPGRGGVQALVIVPTRELCVQVHDDLVQAGDQLDVEVVAVYGGKAMEPQIAAIERGAGVVVGTPGRLLDLANRGVLDLSGATTLVLDEADEMLDLGFLPDVESLIERTAEQRQTLLFSATMPSAVVALARRYMSKPTFLRADVEEVHVAPETQQHFFSCHRMDKPAVVARILQKPDRGLCVVFTRTKRMADILADELRERGVAAAPIHSDLRQEAREKALSRFRDGKVTVLVATEVAARGLDISDVTHVINYDCPDDEKMYLHRIGRTGRAGAAGVAVTLAVWNELARLEMIKKALGIVEPTHEVFSTSPVLDELLGLPERTRRPVRTVTAEDVKTARRSGGRRSGSGSKRRSGAAEAGSTSTERASAEVAEEADDASTSSDAAETSGDASSRSGGRSRSRRRGGRRGGAASSSSGPSGDDQTDEPTSGDADAGASAAGASVEAADADAGGETRNRTRTRSRRRTAVTERTSDARTVDDAGAEQTADAAADEAGGTGDRAEDSAATADREGRERSRRSSSRGGNRRGGGSSGGRRGDAQGGTGGRSGSSSTRSGSGSTGGRRGGSASGSAPGRSGGGSGGSGSGSGRNGGNGGNGSGSGRSGSGGSRTRAPKVDPQAARAEGKPALRRPLTIAHLP